MTNPEPTLAERRAQQRSDWEAAIAAQHRAQRNGRGKRKPAEPTGFVIPPMEPACDLVTGGEPEAGGDD